MRSELKQKIKETHYFLVLGTKEYFTDPECIEQVAYAKELKKPFKILLEEGAKLPDGFLDGIEDHQVVSFVKRDEESYKTAINALFKGGKS